VLSFSLLPTALATYRERGILRRLRTTPVPPSRLLGAQLFVNLLLALAAIVLVVVIGIVAFRFPVPRSFPAFVVSVLLSTLALTSIGLFVAAVAPTQRVATGIGVAFYFVNLVLGGIFVPSQALPPALADAGGFTPLGAMLQSIQDTWGGHHVGVAPLIVLGGIVVVFGGLATRFFRWE
jgi:ABC-2 type transport system permease protein